MDRWTMRGRAEEAALLAQVVADPDRSGILVAGQAGVGKTRLVREVAGALDAHVELVLATESARSLPFGAFAHLLPEDVGGTERIDLLAVVGRHLARRAEGRSLVLVVDDVHHLDDLSAALVHHLVRARVATVLLTLRSGEASPDAVAALQQDGTIDRLELLPVSRTDFDHMIEGALGGPVEKLTLDQVWATTQGNVLFVQELITDALGAGTLINEHGVWHWTGGLGVAVRLRETVAARLGSLDADERGLLEFLAVGEPLNITTAERVAPGASIPDLERRGLAVAEVTEIEVQVRLAHPAFGEALRAMMPVSLFRHINRTLAEDLANDANMTHRDALKISILCEAAGTEIDPHLLVEGARIANVLWDYRLAERLARAAVREGGGFHSGLELGRALEGQNRFGASELVLAPLIGHEPNDAERERLADTYSIVVGYGLGRLSDALSVLRSVEEGTSDPVVKALVQCHQSTLLVFAARFNEAASLTKTAMDSVDDEIVRVRANVLHGISLTMDGELDEALRISRDTFPLSLAVMDRDPRAPSWAVSLHIIALFLAGHFDEGQLFFDLTIGTVSNPPPQQVAAANAYRSRFSLAQGRAQSAIQLLNDVAVALRDTPATVEPSWALALSAEAYALLGQHEQARDAANEALSLRRSELIAFHVDELRALAWVDAQEGRISSAIDQLTVAADLARTRHQGTFELIILGDLLRLGHHRVAQRALELSTRIDGEWSVAIAAHATAVLSNDVADWRAAAETFRTFGSNLAAAELWALVSVIYQRERLSARASEAARQSRQLLELCEGARTQPLSWATDPVPLSRREQEVATLAARGASNPQIADALSVSIRTVESHLHSVFGKLGVTQRDQLSAVLPV